MKEHKPMRYYICKYLADSDGNVTIGSIFEFIKLWSFAGLLFFLIWFMVACLVGLATGSIALSICVATAVILLIMLCIAFDEQILRAHDKITNTVLLSCKRHP